MTCVVAQTDGSFVTSTEVPCTGYLLVNPNQQINNQQITHLDAQSVGLFFGAAAGLYALTFVFRTILSQFGIYR